MCVAWLAEIKRGPSGLPPTKRAPDGPPAPYPTLRPNGRGSSLCSAHRRRIPPPQSPRPMLRVHKEALGLGGHRAGPLRAVAGRPKRALVLARRREVLRAPVPGIRGALHPFLAAPKGEETKALLEPCAGSGLRVGRRSGDLDRRLDAAFGDSDPGKSGTPAVSSELLG